MNVNATQQSYTNYQTQSSSSTSKTESTSGDFLSAMQEVESNKNEIEENKEVDLLDVQAYKDMTLEEKEELRQKLKDVYKEKSFGIHIALLGASQFENKGMQDDMFNKLSNMSVGNALNYLTDLSQNQKRFKAGKELNPSYSIIGIDRENGHAIFNYNDNTANSNAELTSDEFKDFLLSMSQTHHSKQSVVGQQAEDYAKFYEDILDLYTKNYSDKENSYQPYA